MPGSWGAGAQQGQGGRELLAGSALEATVARQLQYQMP